jgi:glycosyltransferase involved in cell wall biosynthesis
MRVLFLTLYPDVAASPRYRVTQYLPYLRTQGVQCTVASPLTTAEMDRLTGPNRTHAPRAYHLKETFRRLRQILTASRYDIVFVQKAIMSAYISGFLEMLRKRAVRLVYDIDDAVHLAPPHPLRAPWNRLEDRRQVVKLMMMADLVLAGNSWLLSEAREAGCRNAVLFPTVVDTERFTPAKEGPDLYRIGWIGNPSTTVCLEPAAEALSRLSDAEICLVGADPSRVPFHGGEVRPWSHETELAELRRFSVGIMPQPRTTWMQGKCALKALQYMACGIPCAASPFGAALEFMQDEENALFCESTDDWMTAFERLRDPVLRRRLGQAGRETVLERYALKAAAPRLLELLGSLR